MKEERITLRVTKTERKMIEKKAKAVGLGMSAYILSLIYKDGGKNG